MIVILSGGAHGGTEIDQASFTPLGGYLFYVTSDGYQYRLIDEEIEPGKKQAVFVGKVF